MWGIICIGIILFFLLKPKKDKTSSPAKTTKNSSTISEPKESSAVSETEENSEQNKPAELDLHNAYQKKWLFSYNEKDAFWKLKKIAEEKGYLVFAKVRLIDLVEPTQGNPKYKTFFYKVQAKHVDFVLCDQKLVARIVIELDDSSHEKADRAERDIFVDTILRNNGYKVIRVKAISDNILDEIK